MRHALGFLAAVLSISYAAPAFAQASSCTLALNNGGTMALSSDGSVLGSEQSSGSSAALAIASLGSATVQVSEPDLTEWPSGYDRSNELVQLRYLGTGGLGAIAQPYTDQTTSFSISLLPLSILTLNARIINGNSFDAGTYRARTVVTCF